MLSAYADCLVGALLPHEPLAAIPATRALVRELLAACVLRPIMCFAWPASVGKVGRAGGGLLRPVVCFAWPAKWARSVLLQKLLFLQCTTTV